MLMPAAECYADVAAQSVKLTNMVHPFCLIIYAAKATSVASLPDMLHTLGGTMVVLCMPTLWALQLPLHEHFTFHGQMNCWFHMVVANKKLIKLVLSYASLSVGEKCQVRVPCV